MRYADFYRWKRRNPERVRWVLHEISNAWLRRRYKMYPGTMAGLGDASFTEPKCSLCGRDKLVCMTYSCMPEHLLRKEDQKLKLKLKPRWRTVRHDSTANA